MAKFRENELTEKLKGFENKNKVKLEFERGIGGKFEIEDATVKYNSQTGFIEIDGKNCVLQINTTMVCKYEKIDDEIIIDLETVLLKITK